jgi:uncharacterized protein YdaU (DUF1376 family)
VGSALNYYERHIGDYLKDTAHLSLLEHGVYGRLLDVYYTREGGIPVAESARLIGAKSKDERAALGVVLTEFFFVDGDMLKQARCDLEIARFKDKQRKAKASADARWSHTDRSAGAMRTHSEGNAPSNQTPDTRTEANASVAAKPPRASRKCPAAFEPEDPDGFIARERLAIDWRAETATFRDHTFKTAISDWQGAWRNWMRRAQEFGQRKPATTAESFTQRAARARVESIAPGVAARPAQPATEIFDVTPRLVG